MRRGWPPRRPARVVAAVGAAESSRRRVRHALFVAFHYPPEASSSGVLRTLKYTRYLPTYGWRVTVLTLNRDAYTTVDPALERQIPEDVRVVRTRYFDTKRHFAFRGSHLAVMAIPDRWIGWWPWATAEGRRIVRADPAHLVYSTSPHGTAHLIAATLARAAAIPWVADFRDPWYDDPPSPQRPAVAVWAARRLERRVVHRADLVVASTNALRDQIGARCAGEPSSKFVAIPNGYDEADFADSPVARRRRNNEMLVVHAGGLDPDYRDPRPVFAATAAAAHADGVQRSRIRFRFIGGGPFGTSAAMARAVAEAQLQDRVEFLPRIPYAAALAELQHADLLLLLQASYDTVNLVPAKLFEYLRASRPLLAVAYPGATGEILNDVGGGWHVDPRHPTALPEALTTIYRKWCADELDSIVADPSKLLTFSRQHLAAKLANYFDTLHRPG